MTVTVHMLLFKNCISQTVQFNGENCLVLRKASGCLQLLAIYIFISYFKLLLSFLHLYCTPSTPDGE